MNEQWTELFDRADAGTLSESQMNEFRERLQNEPQFNEAYAEYNGLLRVIRVGVQEQLRSELRLVRKELEQEAPLQRGFRVSMGRSWLLAAALTGVLAVVAWWLWLRTGSPGELYAQYFEVYPAPAVTRSTDYNEATVAEFNELYNSKNYVEAANLLQQGNPFHNREERAFYYAMCVINYSDRLKTEAMDSLNTVIELRGPYSGAAQWHAALYAVRFSDYTRAKPYLMKLVELDDYKAAQARKLLRAIGD